MILQVQLIWNLIRRYFIHSNLLFFIHKNFDKRYFKIHSQVTIMILLIRNHKNVIRLRAHSNSEEIKFMSAMAYIIEVNRKKKGTNVVQDSVNVHQSNVTVRCYARFIIEIIESMLIYEKKKRLKNTFRNRSF